MSLSIINNREDAEDAVQEVFVKIWNKQEKLESLKNIEAFVITVTRNHCLDKLRSKKNRFATLNEEITKQTDATPYENTEQSDLVSKIKKVMKLLPEQQRTIVHLRDIEGYNFEEIMQITGWDMNYLRVNLSRGRKRIKESVSKLHDYESSKY